MNGTDRQYFVLQNNCLLHTTSHKTIKVKTVALAKSCGSISYRANLRLWKKHITSLPKVNVNIWERV